MEPIRPPFRSLSTMEGGLQTVVAQNGGSIPNGAQLDAQIAVARHAFAIRFA